MHTGRKICNHQNVDESLFSICIRPGIPFFQYARKCRHFYVTLLFVFPSFLCCVPCVCVRVFFPFIMDIKLDIPAGVTQKEGHTGFFIHLPSAVRVLMFLARRIQPFLSLVDCKVEFCVLTI